MKIYCDYKSTPFWKKNCLRKSLRKVYGTLAFGHALLTAASNGLTPPPSFWKFKYFLSFGVSTMSPSSISSTKKTKFKIYIFLLFLNHSHSLRTFLLSKVLICFEKYDSESDWIVKKRGCRNVLTHREVCDSFWIKY